MSTQTQEFAIELGRRLVAQHAPHEQALYPVLIAQYRQLGSRSVDKAKDQKLGFGAAEAVALLSPAILAICAAVGEQLVVLLTERGVNALARRLSDATAAAPIFTDQQREHVRQVAFKKARQLNLDSAQARLLADAVVGNLDAHA